MAASPPPTAPAAPFELEVDYDVSCVPLKFPARPLIRSRLKPTLRTASTFPPTLRRSPPL